MPYHGENRLIIDAVSPAKRSIVYAMSRDFLFFVRTIAPHLCSDKETGEQIPFGAVHYAMMHDLPGTSLGQQSRDLKRITMIQLPRGYAKSTIVTIMWSIWQALFKNKHHIPISSVEEDTSANFLETIGSIIESDTFKFYFGECKGDKWNKSERILTNPGIGLKCRIASYGVGQSVVGLNWLGFRPDLWIFDDIENADTVDSIKVVNRRESWIYTTVLPALQGSSCPIVFIGTPFAIDCVLTRVEGNRSMCRVIKYPALVENEKQSIKLKVPIGCSIWEEKHPTAKVIAEREAWEKAGKLNEWNLANMLRASAAKVKGFEDMPEYSPEEIQDKDLAYYILCDFAYSRKASADPAAIAVLGIDTSARNKVYDLESHEGQWGDVGAINKLVDIIKRYHSIATADNKRLTVGIESYSFDMVKKLLYENLSTVDMRNVSVIQLQPNGRAKISRMQALIPYCETGRFLLKKNNVMLKAQMTRFDGLTDSGFNLLDATSYILDFLFQRRPQETEEEKQNKAWREIVEMIESHVPEENLSNRREIIEMEDEWF